MHCGQGGIQEDSAGQMVQYVEVVARPLQYRVRVQGYIGAYLAEEVPKPNLVPVDPDDVVCCTWERA